MTAVTVTTLTSIAARFERATRFAARRFARVPMLAAALVGSSGVTLTSVAWAQSGGLPLPSSQAVSSVPSVGQILQQAASAGAEP